MRILATFTHLEIYSINEVFLNLDGFKDLEQHCRTIRKTILQWTGLPNSIGIASTKTLAKVANRLAKKDLTANGVRQLLDQHEQIAALRQLETA